MKTMSVEKYNALTIRKKEKRQARVKKHNDKVHHSIEINRKLINYTRKINKRCLNWFFMARANKLLDKLVWL